MSDLSNINPITALLRADFPGFPISLWQLLTHLANRAEDSGAYAADVYEADTSRSSPEFDAEMVAYINAPRMVAYAENRLRAGRDEITFETVQGITRKLVEFRQEMGDGKFAILYRIIVYLLDDIRNRFSFPTADVTPRYMSGLEMSPRDQVGRRPIRDLHESISDLVALCKDKDTKTFCITSWVA